MRTILAIVLLIAVSACRSTSVVQEFPGAVGPNLTGAPTSRVAVETFFAAMKAGDIQAASAIWGSKQGASRDYMQRDELETRLLTIQCWLAHETMSVVGTPRTKSDSAFYRVELTGSGRSQQTDVIVVTGGRPTRWYVGDPKISGLVAPGCR